MSFRLRNAVQTFQRFMDVVSRRLPFIYAYVVDLLLVNSYLEERLQYLRLLFERLRSHCLIINADKCEFGVTSLEFLGHLVDGKGRILWL